MSIHVNTPKAPAAPTAAGSGIIVAWHGPCLFARGIEPVAQNGGHGKHATARSRGTAPEANQEATTP